MRMDAPFRHRPNTTPLGEYDSISAQEQDESQRSSTVPQRQHWSFLDEVEKEDEDVVDYKATQELEDLKDSEVINN